MKSIFALLFFLFVLFLVIGMIKPSIVLFWLRDSFKTRKHIVVIGVCGLIIALIGFSVLPQTDLIIKSSIENNSKTELQEVTFSGEAPGKSSLLINNKKVEISKEKFSETFKLSVGENRFQVSYKFESKNEEAQYSFYKKSEQDIQKEKAEEEKARKDKLTKEEAENKNLKENGWKSNLKSNQKYVSADGFGVWPLTVKEGILTCHKIEVKRDPKAARVTFTDKSGKVYAVNGFAFGYGLAIDPIWKNNPENPGAKISMSALIEEGLSACKF